MKFENIYYHEEHDTDGSCLLIEYTERAAVFGGWLIKYTAEDHSEKLENFNWKTECMAFLPDSHHEWIV
jgi:hypothetical protein